MRVMTMAKPTIIRTTPDGPRARAVMQSFLDARTTPMPGHIVSMHDFAAQFIGRVDREFGPVLSLWWGQKSRIRRALTDLGHSVGWYASTYGVANLSMHNSRAVAQSRLRLEYDAPGIGLHLAPSDYDGGIIPD